MVPSPECPIIICSRSLRGKDSSDRPNINIRMTTIPINQCSHLNVAPYLTISLILFSKELKAACIL